MDERNDYNSIPMQHTQTAVEWLQIQLKKGIDFNSLDPLSYPKSVDNIFKQAKQMEKEQIIEAFCEGNNDISAEQYYNQTYNNENTNGTSTS